MPDQMKFGVNLSSRFITGMQDEDIETQLSTNQSQISVYRAYLRDPRESLMKKDAPEAIEAIKQQNQLLEAEKALRANVRQAMQETTKGWDRHQLRIAANWLNDIVEGVSHFRTFV